MIVDINLALRVWEKTIDYLTLIHADMPAEERRKIHERWGKIWDTVWQDQPKPTDPTP